MFRAYTRKKERAKLQLLRIISNIYFLQIVCIERKNYFSFPIVLTHYGVGKVIPKYAKKA